MLWEAVLIDANEVLNSIPMQFISVNELLELFARLEKVTIEQSAQWLSNNIHMLKRSKKLVLVNSYTLIEYEFNLNDFYNCPIKTIRLIASGEDEEFSSDYVGFSRFQLLKDLESIGLDIDKNLISNSCVYISQSCYERDDNFYKNQCIHLNAELNQKINNQEISPKTEKINFLYLLDKNNPSYNTKLALLLRITHDLITVERFDHKATKQEKIAECLDEYGRDYNVSNTSTYVTHFANLINTRDKSKTTTSVVMKKILQD